MIKVRMRSVECVYLTAAAEISHPGISVLSAVVLIFPHRAGHSILAHWQLLCSKPLVSGNPKQRSTMEWDMSI